MAKRKKKNAITLITLLLALVLLIGAYVFFLNQGDDTSENSEKTVEHIVLETMEGDQLESLHLINADADLELLYEEGTWSSQMDPNRPIKQSYVKNMVNLITEVKAIKEVTDQPEDLSAYGLEDPAAIVKAAQSDGKTLTLRIGNQAISGEGYYGTVNDNSSVYLLATTYGVGFQYTDIDMTEVEKGPTINAEHIHHITVENRDGDNFELLYNADNKQDYTNSSLFSWVILQPYEEGYSADGTKVSETLPKFNTFNYLACLDYDSNDLSSYGLEEPYAAILVEYYEYYTETLEEPEVDPTSGETIEEKTYYDDKSYKIYVGDMDPTGNYYVRREDSNAVYTMKAEDVNKMLQVNPFDLMSVFVVLPNIESVKAIEATVDGAPYSMVIERTTEKNEEGEEETVATYYYNEEVVEESNFKSVYQSMISAKFDTVIEGDVETEGLEPVLTIQYHLIGEEEEILSAEYLPYNDSFYLIRKDGNVRFFADKRSIDQIVRNIKDLKSN